jgi:hypothetical protein
MLGVLEHSRHRGDESRSAVAALRTMTTDHRILHGSQLTATGQSFDRYDVRAVELKEKLDAGVDRPVLQYSVFTPADENRTRTAVSLFADDLRSGSSKVVAQKSRERLKGIVCADPMRDPIDVDEQLIAHCSRF